jgi:hypothetical protein
MKRRTFYRNTDILAFLLLDLGVFAGVIVTILFPGFGWVVGPILIVIGVSAGLRIRSAWNCTGCSNSEVFWQFGKLKSKGADVER